MNLLLVSITFSSLFRAMTGEDRKEAMERERLRRERKRERDREMRLKVRGRRNIVSFDLRFGKRRGLILLSLLLSSPSQAAGRKTKSMRDADRDISEKVALGMHVPGKIGLAGEAAFDQRLFNQEEGIGSGFADDESEKEPVESWLENIILLLLLL